MVTEEERRARLENDAAMKLLMLAMDMESKTGLPNGSHWPCRQLKKEKQDWRIW